MNTFGFWDDLPRDQRFPALSRLQQPSPHPEKARVLNYLRSARVVTLIPGVFHDELDAARPIIDSPHEVSDGNWTWTLDVPFYFDKYNIRLPDEFVSHMQSNAWKCPDANPED